MANTTITPIGSLNKNPSSIALSQAYNDGSTTGKYATYLKLFSGK